MTQANSHHRDLRPLCIHPSRRGHPERRAVRRSLPVRGAPGVRGASYQVRNPCSRAMPASSW